MRTRVSLDGVLPPMPTVSVPAGDYVAKEFYTYTDVPNMDRRVCYEVFQNLPDPLCVITNPGKDGWTCQSGKQLYMGQGLLINPG